MIRYILASGSPRRKELLGQIGLQFEISVATGEEIITKEKPWEIVEELSRQKALEVAERYIGQQRGDTDVIIGADTIVAFENGSKTEIMGKPKDAADAKRMLKLIQNNTHQVYTGVAILKYDLKGNETIINQAVKTDVYVNPMTDEEIWNYIEKDNVMDKAGAYGIQSGFAIHIEKIEGDYFNVVGLPISFIYEAMKGEER